MFVYFQIISISTSKKLFNVYDKSHLNKFHDYLSNILNINKFHVYMSLKNIIKKFMLI